MYDNRPRTRRSTWLAATGAVVAIALVVTGAYMLGSSTAPRPAATQVATPNPAPTTPGPSNATASTLSASPAPVEPGRDPVATAVAWLRAYRTIRYDDPTPTAWIDRVRPLVTDRLAATYERYRGGSVGAEWDEFVDQQCISMVEGASGVIPPEAPRTNDAVYVQVAGSLHTKCRHKGAVDRLVEHLAATVRGVKGDDERWRVDRRLY